MQADHGSSLVERAAERLYEDERLRSNLSDSEAKIVLSWAVKWISDQVASSDVSRVAQTAQDETARVRQAVSSFNELAKKPGDLKLADAIAALESPIQVRSLNREQVFRLLTVLTTEIWTMRAEPAKPKPSHDPNEMVATKE